MELFETVRKNIGNRILVKKNTKIKRSVFYPDINHIKNVGIVWDSSNPDDFQYLSKFYQKLSDRNIRIKVIGYYPGKVLPDQYTALRYVSFIRREEVNFFYIPVTNDALEFINFGFDVLIDINFRKILPLNYISSLSASRFKVGLSGANAQDSPFDLLMEFQNPINIENYLNEVLYYLEMIKSGETTK